MYPDFSFPSNFSFSVLLVPLSSPDLSGLARISSRSVFREPPFSVPNPPDSSQTKLLRIGDVFLEMFSFHRQRFFVTPFRQSSFPLLPCVNCVRVPAETLIFSHELPPCVYHNSGCLTSDQVWVVIFLLGSTILSPVFSLASKMSWTYLVTYPCISLLIAGATCNVSSPLSPLVLRSWPFHKLDDSFPFHSLTPCITPPGWTQATFFGFLDLPVALRILTVNRLSPFFFPGAAYKDTSVFCASTLQGLAWVSRFLYFCQRPPS